VVSLFLAVALIVYPALAPSSLRGLFVFVGIVGVGALVVAVVAAAPGLVGLGLLILFLEYGVSLVTGEKLDWGAPVYGAALLLLGEVVYSLAARHRVESTAAEGLRTIVVVVLAVGSGFLVLGVVAIPLPHGGLMQALGAGGAAALVLGLASLARART
jgi:hypothetical protein